MHQNYTYDFLAHFLPVFCDFEKKGHKRAITCPFVFQLCTEEPVVKEKRGHVIALSCTFPFSRYLTGKFDVFCVNESS